MKRPAVGGFGSTDALSPAVGGVVESTPAVGRESDSSLGRRIRQQPLAWTHVYQSLPDDLIQLLADSLPVADMQRPEGQGCVDHLRRSALLGACQGEATRVFTAIVKEATEGHASRTRYSITRCCSLKQVVCSYNLRWGL